ncbi:MAG: helix-turn-helix transcriptional regulator, partial [Pseudomonadota bacterium]
MAIGDFSRNLQLLCSYGKSVADICRRAGINRTQFNRYLVGSTQPSLSTLRKLCDFFGLEDHEIFLDHDEFREIVKLRPPRLQASESPLSSFIDRLVHADPQSCSGVAPYQGLYHIYYQPSVEPVLIRSLCRIYAVDDIWFSHTEERYSGGNYSLPESLVFEGLVIYSADRLVVYEREN